MPKLVHKVPYLLPKKNYNYTIPAKELKYKVEEIKEEENVDFSSFNMFYSPFSAVPVRKTKSQEIKNITTTNKEFLVFIEPCYDVTFTIENMDGDYSNYKVFVEKTNKMTGKKDSFLCLIDQNIVKNILIP